MLGQNGEKKGLAEQQLAHEALTQALKTNFDNKIGFIAQDLQDSYVGQLIVGEWEGQLSYNLNNYVSVLGGALQYDIMYRDEQITILEDRIVELENRIAELENKLNK